MGLHSKVVLSADVHEAKRAAEEINPWTKKKETVWTKAGKGRYNFNAMGVRYIVQYRTKGTDFNRIYGIRAQFSKAMVAPGVINQSPISLWRSSRKIFFDDLGTEKSPSRFNNGLGSMCWDTNSDSVLAFNCNVWRTSDKKVLVNITGQFWTASNKGYVGNTARQ
jgi:hypothetical protein